MHNILSIVSQLKRKSIQIIWASILCYFGAIISCKTDNSKNKAVENQSQGTTDYFPAKVDIKYAKNFTVSYHGNYKVVHTSATLGDWDSPGGETEDIKDVMVLVERGTKAPELTGELQGAALITVPATEKIGTNSAGLEVWMEMLALEDKQVFIGGTKTYNDSIRRLAESGRIGQVGYSWAEPPTMEVVLDRKPDIFLMVISRVGFNTALDKIRSLGVASAPVFDWAERDYLATAEWIKYCSLFFNKEAEANSIFNEIEDNIDSLKQLVSTVEKKPTCLWANFYANEFWMSNTNNGPARLLKDAGVINPLEDFTKPFNPTGEAFTNEELLVQAKDAQHWIIGSGVRTSLPEQDYLRGFTAWRTDKLYHHYKRSKPENDIYDWFNLWPARPDLALADLIHLFHPKLLPKHETTFFDTYEKSKNFR